MAIIIYCIVLCCVVLCCVVLCCVVLCCIVLYCIVLYCIVLYCIVLYCNQIFIALAEKLLINQMFSWEAPLTKWTARDPLQCTVHDMRNDMYVQGRAESVHRWTPQADAWITDVPFKAWYKGIIINRTCDSMKYGIAYQLLFLWSAVWVNPPMHTWGVNTPQPYSTPCHSTHQRDIFDQLCL